MDDAWRVRKVGPGRELLIDALQFALPTRLRQQSEDAPIDRAVGRLMGALFDAAPAFADVFAKHRPPHASSTCFDDGFELSGLLGDVEELGKDHVPA